MNEKTRFYMYCNWSNLFDCLSNEDAGILIKAIFKYQEDGDLSALPENVPGNLQGLFYFMTDQMDKDYKKYQEVCKRNSENAQKRWTREQE